MHTQIALSSSTSFTSSSVDRRFIPPTHVHRWTGRAPLTIPLPSLAALRIAGADRSAPRACAATGRN